MLATICAVGIGSPNAAAAKASLSGGKGADALVAPSAPGAATAAAIDRIQADDNYQLDLPEPEPVVRREPNGLDSFFNWLGGPGRWLVNALFVIIVGAAALYILYLTVPAARAGLDKLLWRFRRKRHDDGVDDHWQPDHSRARNLLADADALAQAARFDEAVHLLLGHSVDEIARRRPGILHPALTARAIATLDDVPVAARDAFGRIAAAVERSLWARRGIDQGEWTVARAAYEAFAFGDQWRQVRI